MVKDLQLVDYAGLLTKRERNTHKGNFGHVLIIGGDIGYSGAMRLAAEAALRVGAGLVTVATHPQHSDLINLIRPEIMSFGVGSPKELMPFVEKASVIIVGPGLGKHSWGHSLWTQLESVDKFMVVDADALNFLAEKPFKKANWILTPHPGEAGRLLQTDTTAVQADRINAIQKLQQKYSGIVVLKGAGTLVCDEAQTIKRCHFGNPGMSTAGMGDVLSGIIGGLLAQNFGQCPSAELGVLVHALAADLAAQTGERGLLASDLFAHLKTFIN